VANQKGQMWMSLHVIALNRKKHVENKILEDFQWWHYNK
jgi:hypothetical protein